MVSIIKIIFEILEIVFHELAELFFDMVISVLPTSRKETYDARFIRAEDILYKNVGGVCIDGIHSAGNHLSFKHCICYASSGSLKSVSIVVPTILGIENNASMIIHDPSMELLRLTGASLKARGFNVKVLNFCDPSEGFSPLTRIKNETDIRALSQTIINNTIGFSGDKFWSVSAQNLITTFISLVLKCLPEEQQSLYIVYQLITIYMGEPERLDRLFARSRHAGLIAEAKALASMDKKLLSNITTTALSALQIFNEESVALSTSMDSLGDFETLRHESTAIFITNSVPKSKQYAVVTAVFIEQLLSYFMDNVPEKSANGVYFILEEAGVFYLNSLPVAISVLRKHSVSILQIYQHPAQLKMYGELAKSIHANSGIKIYLGGGIPQDTAEELSKALGQFEYNDDGVRRIMPLMTPDSVRQMDESIVFIGSKPPIKTKLTPYFKNRKLLKLTQLPEYTPECKIPYTTAPQINLD